MSEMDVAPIGAQIVLEVRLGERIGQAGVHWERSGLSGVHGPGWADPHEIARQAAAHLRAAADAIAARIPAPPGR